MWGGVGGGEEGGGGCSKPWPYCGILIRVRVTGSGLLKFKALNLIIHSSK